MEGCPVQHEYESADAFAVVLVRGMVRIDIALNDVGLVGSLARVRESDILSTFKVTKDVLCGGNVRWSWVGHELRAGANGVSDVRPRASSNVHEKAYQLLVHLGVIKVGNGWAVALGELDIRHEWCMLDFAVHHVEALEHVLDVGALINRDGSGL